MRKQYHLQPSKNGVMAWDVERLIAHAKGLPVRDVPLREIAELDENFWFQEEKNRPTCRAVAAHALLINQVDMRYPILLSASGRVMDGMHRVCRALIDGEETIKAVRFERDPEPDYVDVNPENLPY
jgi:hypothetical protein